MDTSARSDVRVAVLTDRRLYRDTLVAGLSSHGGLRVVGHAATVPDLVDVCTLRAPHTVLIALVGEPGAALTAATAVRRACPSVALALVYEQLTPAQLAALWRAGVDRLVPASHGLGALVAVLRRPAGGALAAEPPDTVGDSGDPDRSAATPGGRIDGAAGPGAPAPDGAQAAAGGELTEREREIVALVSSGHTIAQVARLLGLRVHEVENSKRRIYRKLDVASHSQIVARAAALGVMDGDGPGSGVDFTRAPGMPGVPLVMLRGGPGVDLSPVTAALLAGGLPFALEQFPAPPDEARGPQRWHRGPTVLVLVEPGPGDWPTARTTPIVLVRGGQQPPVDMADALARSIAGVLPVDRVAEDLVPAVTLAAHGYLTMDSGWARAWLAGRSGAPVGGLPELTVRESDILRSIAAGHTVRQTARSLGIAEKTVENTQARLFRKLGAHNRAGALATAHAWGLVDPSPPAADGSLSCVCPPVT